MSFTSIPNLDLSQARDPWTKTAFLAELRHALIEVGFMYIRGTGIPDGLWEDVIRQGIAFFQIPEEEKLKIEMKNAASFLGYSRLAAEITAHAPDQREQIDLSTPHAMPPPTAPLYHNLLAPNQWPSPAHLPDFRPVFERYITLMSELSMELTDLIAQAVGLSAGAFAACFDAEQQHKLKIVKYPETDPQTTGGGGGMVDMRGRRRAQGVGPHKDSMLSSYLLQATPHLGLQVQNIHGAWIDVPPIDKTLVVAIGQGMEALTRGVCVSTTHRVLSPLPGEGARYSIPFFQGVGLDARFEDLDAPDGVGASIPEEVKIQREYVRKKAGGRRDDVEFTFGKGGKSDTLGEATLRNRAKSHQDVAGQWYPELLEDVKAEMAEKGVTAGGAYD